MGLMKPPGLEVLKILVCSENLSSVVVLNQGGDFATPGNM